MEWIGIVHRVGMCTAFLCTFPSFREGGSRFVQPERRSPKIHFSKFIFHHPIMHSVCTLLNHISMFWARSLTAKLGIGEGGIDILIFFLAIDCVSRVHHVLTFLHIAFLRNLVFYDKEPGTRLPPYFVFDFFSCKFRKYDI